MTYPYPYKRKPILYYLRSVFSKHFVVKVAYVTSNTKFTLRVIKISDVNFFIPR